MSVNLKVENTFDNPHLASYNALIELGVDNTSRIFNFNIEQNANCPFLIEIIDGSMEPDAHLEIQHIVKKLECNEKLTREDQIVMGMAYILFRQIAQIPKGKPLSSSTEAHPEFPKRMIDPRKGLLAPKTNAGGSQSSSVRKRSPLGQYSSEGT